MESRIWREKIMLVYHVSHLDEGSLAKEMLEEQVGNNWPGLASEVSSLCQSMNLEDPRTTEKSRKVFNNLVKEGCRWKDEARMKEEMQKMKEKKMRTMVNQNLEMKDYVRKGTLYSARKTWEVRSHMLDVAGNYPGINKYKASGWMCQACNQEHLTVCNGYEDLRHDADLNMENELVDFFTRVMERRRLNKWD